MSFFCGPSDSVFNQQQRSLAKSVDGSLVLGLLEKQVKSTLCLSMLEFGSMVVRGAAPSF